MIIYSRRFNENIESQKQLEMLAELIIKESVTRSIPIMKNRVIETEKDEKFHGNEYTFEQLEFDIEPIYWPVLVVNKGKINLEHVGKLDKEIKAFLKTLNILRIEFFEKGNKSNIDGDYHRNHINIYIDSDTYDKAQGEVVEAYATEGFPLERKYSILTKLLSTKKDVIVHELQHFYDDWRSEGLYNKSKRAQKSYSGNSDDYLTSPQEISARYTQTIFYLKNKGVLYKDWKTVLNTFTTTIGGWKIIPKDEQKRLIKRLSQEWQDNQKSEKPLLDISNQVKKLQSTFNIDEIEIRYYKKEYIEIQRLNTGNIREDEKALKEIIKLADTYRHMIMTYIEKGWFTNIKQSIDLLKSYDFKPNAGRNTNFKYKTSKQNFIRYTKRK